MEKPKFEATKLKISDIQPHRALLPVSNEIKGNLEPNIEAIERRKSLAKEYGYYDRLIVWRNEGTCYLVSNYEQYKVLRQIDPDYLVDCLVVSASFDTVKTISLRLQQLQLLTAKETYFERCLNLRLLLELGYTCERAKRAYGAKTSADNKRIERDWKLVEHPQILIRVLGLDSEMPETEFAVNIAKPNPYNAKLKYSTALEVLKILAESPEQVMEYASLVDKYVDELTPRNESELAEPVFNWKDYNEDRVLGLAHSIVKRSLSIASKNKHGVGDHGLDDIRSEIRFDNKTGVFRFQDIAVDLKSKNRSALKKICETHYCLSVLNSILEKYMRATQPDHHGDQIPFADHSVDQFINYEQAYFRTNDRGYLGFVMQTKFLHYANKERLLKSLSLAPHNFGFKGFDHDSLSSYEEAHASFVKWYETIYIKAVKTKFTGFPERHPLNDYYQEIMVFLEERKHVLRKVFFGDFILEMFTHVFKAVERQNRVLRDRSFEIARSEAVFKENLGHSTWDKIRQAGFTESELSQIARAYHRFDNRTVFEATVAVAQQVETLQEGFAKIVRLQPDGLPDEGASE